jgi:hypothetical protein
MEIHIRILRPHPPHPIAKTLRRVRASLSKPLTLAQTQTLLFTRHLCTAARRPAQINTRAPPLPRAPQTQFWINSSNSIRTSPHTSYPLSTVECRRNKPSMATSEPSVPAAINAAPPVQEHKPLLGVEASKRRAAYKAVEDHFENSYRYIGIGSGSTVVYVVEAIAAKGRDVTSRMIFVPTYDPLFCLNFFHNCLFFHIL